MGINGEDKLTITKQLLATITEGIFPLDSGELLCCREPVIPRCYHLIKYFYYSSRVRIKFRQYQ